MGFSTDSSIRRLTRGSFISQFILCSLVALAALCFAPRAEAQTLAQWVGPDGGFWSDPNNWDIGRVPANSDLETFNVIIPTNANVVFDLMDPTQITGISTSPSTISLTDTSLEILGVASIGDLVINADGSLCSFLTSKPFTSGSNTTSFATNGSLIKIAHQSYVLNRRFGNGIFLKSDGMGSLIDISSCGSINATAVKGLGTFTDMILASNSGVIDLSQLNTLKGGTSYDGPDWLTFRAESGGIIKLNNLLDTTDGYTWFDLAGGDLILTSLSSCVNTKFTSRSSNTLSLPSLTTLSNCNLEIESGGTIDAPVLSTFINSTLSLNPTTTLNAPPISEVDASKFFIYDGVILSIADSAYIAGGRYGNGVFMKSDGMGSLLNLSSLNSIDATAMSGLGTFTDMMLASNSGVIDLSGLSTLKGGHEYDGPDWLTFRAESGGVIKLDNLVDTTDGYTWFDLDGGTINLDSLASAVNVKLSVSIFNTFNLPSLTSLTGSTLEIQSGGTINAPLLSTFTNSRVSITPTTILNAPPFDEVDASKFFVYDGATFVIADSDYISGGRTGNAFMMSDGMGSLLNLSSLNSIDATAMSGLGSFTNTILASNSGVVDLSGLNSVKGGTSYDGPDWLRFRAESGGQIHFHNFAQSAGYAWLDINGSSSSISLSGNLDMLPTGNASRLSASLTGTLFVSGNIVHSITDPTLQSTHDGILAMNGTGAQYMEVAGTDIGVPTDDVFNNFEWGQLVVGENGRETTVILEDNIDNGNRGPNGEHEALYIQGFPQGDQGLRINGGSTLVLNNLNVYMGTVDGWVHLNTLFGQGQNRVPFDGGFLQLAPTLVLSADQFIGGKKTTWTIENGTPFATVALVYGLQPGKTTLNDVMGYCAQFGIKGINQSKVICQTQFDANGIVQCSSRIPGSFAGTEVFMQAAQRDTCPDQFISNILDLIVQ